MTPFDVLAFAISATALAVAAESAAARRRRKVLRQLAANWRMTYSRFDSLRLTPKVARSFPIPGAANLLVTDVIYGIEHERYRYVFRAEFTVGTVRTKKRLARVATFSEPRDRLKPQGAAPVVLAPDQGSLLEQYRHLAPSLAARAVKAAPAPAAPSAELAATVAAGPASDPRKA